MDWQVERLRLTAFINHKADPEDYKVWKDIFDEHPDESVILRKEQRLQEQGAFNGHHLIMQLQPFRFDWIFLKEKN
ncbi:MAG: hypothetical protein QGG64_24465, partial [Candidatus Latescibacteria bacterium]|nr:hypothetical protein [Candidatus Latescibacterota bacterium]